MSVGRGHTIETIAECRTLVEIYFEHQRLIVTMQHFVAKFEEVPQYWVKNVQENCKTLYHRHKSFSSH